MKFEFKNEIERDYYTFLIEKKGVRESVARNSIEELRKVNAFEVVQYGSLARTINQLKCLLEYENANYEKCNCWARATKNYTKEEVEELHRWMRMD